MSNIPYSVAVSSSFSCMQEQYTEALSQLQQLVQQQPHDYAALAQLLTLLRRVGRAQEGQGFLNTAQEHASRASGVAGADGTICLLARHGRAC